MSDLSFLYTRTPLVPFDLEAAERIALAGDTLAEQLAARLLVEVRRLRQEAARLQHEIDDPAYQYGNGRIHRHAIICRNLENDQLRGQLRELAKKAEPEKSS